MDLVEKKQLAKSMEDRIEHLLVGMTAVLREQGFEDLQVVSFAVGESTDGESSVLMEMVDGTPCPVRCYVLPDGSVRCEPKC